MLAVVAATVFVSLANQPDPFPMPVLRERWAEYAQRWDEWVQSHEPSDLSWTEVLSIQRELMAHRGSDAIDADAPRPQNGGSPKKRDLFLPAQRDIFHRLHALSTRRSLGHTSAGLLDAAFVEHTRLLGGLISPQPDDLPEVALRLRLPHGAVLRDLGEFVILAMDDAISRGDHGTFVEAFEVIAWIVRSHQQPPSLGQFMEAAWAFSSALRRTDHIRGLSDAQMLRISELISSMQYELDLLRVVHFQRFETWDALSYYYEDADEFGYLSDLGRTRLASRLVEQLRFTADAISLEFGESMASEAGTAMEQFELNETLMLAASKDAATAIHDIDGLSYYDALKIIDDTLGYTKRFLPLLTMLPEFRVGVDLQCRVTTHAHAALLYIAAHRHRDRHNEFPASMDRFDSDLIGFELIDQYSGKPLLYGLADGQPLIWSTGPDRVDDRASERVGSHMWIPLDALGEMDEAERAEIRGDIVYFGGP